MAADRPLERSTSHISNVPAPHRLEAVCHAVHGQASNKRSDNTIRSASPSRDVAETYVQPSESRNSSRTGRRFPALAVRLPAVSVPPAVNSAVTAH